MWKSVGRAFQAEERIRTKHLRQKLEEAIVAEDRVAGDKIRGQDM